MSSSSTTNHPNNPCSRVDESMADILDGTASAELIDHIVECDRCRDARYEATEARDVVAKAGADYQMPNDLVDRLMTALDQRVIPAPVDSRIIERPQSPPQPVTQQPAMPMPMPTLARNSKRPPILAIVGTLSVAASIALGFGLAARKNAAFAAGEFTGRVVSTSRASIDPNGGGLEICKPTCAPAKATDIIAAGAKLRRDGRTRARIDLADGTKISLDRDTEVELVAGKARTAKLHKGVLAADVAHIDGSNAQMIMPHTTVKVIGTSFILTATEDMSLVEVTHGEVALLDEKGAATAAVRAGREGRVLAGRAPIVSASAVGAEGREWMNAEDRTSSTPDEEPALRGIGELRAKKPGEATERDFVGKDGKRAVRLAQHHVKVKISGSVARTEIDETFANDSGEELEGIYRMPLPPDAQIERLALEVNGMIEEGSFVARDRAAAIWKGVIHHAAPQTKAEPDIIWVPGPWFDPALLEWQRGGRFELRIFPIPAKGSRRVILAYTQKLDLHGAMRRYTYPLTYDPKGSTVIDAFDVDVRVMGHSPELGLKSRGYTMARAKNEDGSEHVAMSANAFVPAGDLTVEYALPSDETEMTTWTYQQPQKDGYVAFAIRPKLPASQENRDRLYAVVVDSSRSMIGERWKRVTNVTSGIVRDLDRRDQYIVLTCDTECRPIGGDTASSPSPTAVEDVRRALSAVEPEGAHDPARATRLAAERTAALPSTAGKKLHIVYVGDGNVSVSCLFWAWRAW